MKRGQQSPLQLHRLTSDDEVAKAVPVSDWGSIFDKEEGKSNGYEGYLAKKSSTKRFAIALGASVLYL